MTSEGGRRVESTPSRLRSLADFCPDGILGATRDGVVTILNAQGAALLGVDAHDALGMPLADVLRLLDQDGRTWLDVNRPFDSMSIVRAMPEQSWLSAAGEEVLTTATLIRNEPLAPVAGIAVGLRSGRGRARLDRERSDLVATVAHELRSPLTGVKGFVQALLNRWDKLSDDQRKLMLMTVNADADRLARLIAELLDVARIDTGRLQLHRRPTDLGLKAERVHESISVVTSTPIELTIEEDLPQVSADPDKVMQVLTNLVENAVRHGSGTVRVHVGRWEEEPASFVAVTVTDEGDGIPEELRKRIFTKFWTAGTGGGSGLGLYIVRGLVKAHGGAVTVGDRPGGGALIVTTWPVLAG